MNQVREITLELLRHGPPHNQLLSPLTQYLAICGNHGAVTVKIPLEHAQFLARLKPLSYELGFNQETNELRELQLKETAATMCDVLSQVPGLIAALAEYSGRDSKADSLDVDVVPSTHLELVLSASELALLPFELANAPNGFPGAGQSLILQSQSPLCMTRRVRRVNMGRVEWPRRPRILFVAASPQGEIPLQQHVDQLVQSLSPWIDWSDVKDVSYEQAYRKHLTILPKADIASIEREIARGLEEMDERPYTHIHILAHGVKFKEGVDERFGLALHSVKDPTVMDKVSGTRLATALRAYGSRGGTTLALPTVVTIASCQGGQQGSVIGAGASVAHAIHEAGVPLVVASQFPLSFEGSIRMVDVMYHGLLRGHDPRVLINKLRRDLHSQLPSTHDWASIVAYAALPEDIDEQLPQVRVSQTRLSIELAFERYDREKANNFPDPDRVSQLRRWLKDSKDRLERTLKVARPDDRAAIFGLLAATEKKEAEVVYEAAKMGVAADADKKPVAKAGGKIAPGVDQSVRDEIHRLLIDASRHYRDAFDANPTNIWGIVQSLTLSAMLNRGKISRDDWNAARILSDWELHQKDRQRAAWARGNLIELYLLALLMEPGTDGPKPAEARSHARSQALTHLRELIKICGPDDWEVKSTERQIRRFSEWFNKETLGHDLPADVTKLAKELLAEFPHRFDCA